MTNGRVPKWPSREERGSAPAQAVEVPPEGSPPADAVEGLPESSPPADAEAGLLNWKGAERKRSKIT